MATPLPNHQQVALERRMFGKAKQCIHNINVYCKNNPATVIVIAGACSKVSDYFIGRQANVDAAVLIQNELAKNEKSQLEERCDLLEKKVQELERKNSKLTAKVEKLKVKSSPKAPKTTVGIIGNSITVLSKSMKSQGQGDKE